MKKLKKPVVILLVVCILLIFKTHFNNNTVFSSGKVNVYNLLQSQYIGKDIGLNIACPVDDDIGVLDNVTILNTSYCANVIKTYLTKAITDENLLQIYQTCFGNERSSIAHIDSRRFARIFDHEVFKDVECGQRTIEFVKGPALPLVALTGVEGSGNTWTRVLMEQMTGIITGSTAVESNRMDERVKEVLKGSFVCPLSKVYLISSHRNEIDPRGKCGHEHLDYTKAILILRNPYHAALAEFNRENAGKMEAVSKETFNTTEWLKVTTRLAVRWHERVSFYLSTFDKPVHVLVYEALLKNTIWELYKISKFLNFPVSYKTMWCIKSKEGSQKTFKRQKPDWQRPENLYNRQQKRLFNAKITDLISRSGKCPSLQRAFQSYILF